MTNRGVNPARENGRKRLDDNVDEDGPERSALEKSSIRRKGPQPLTEDREQASNGNDVGGRIERVENPVLKRAEAIGTRRDGLEKDRHTGSTTRRPSNPIEARRIPSSTSTAGHNM